jgi:signal transduction histidine kinase
MGAARLALRVADFSVIDLVDERGGLFQAAAAHAQPEKEALLAERGGRRSPGVQHLPDLEAKGYVRLPLMARGRALGEITFGSETRQLDENDRLLLAELGRRAAMAIDNAQLYRESREAVRLRDEFLALASHELNTPTAALTLSLATMLSSPPETIGSERLLKLAQLAERQVHRLTRLIRDLLDVTWFERGSIALEREEVDLGPLVSEAVEAFHEQIARSGCDVSIDCRERIVGRWDPLRIGQVITNLLSNAIKFGAGREVVLRASRAGDVARLSVTDHGIGIEPSQQERIFDRFARAVPLEHFGGLGLGLYISRRILETHGGSISVQSQPNQGSTFTVELPLPPSVDSRMPAGG